jgi:hypothetical protein
MGRQVSEILSNWRNRMETLMRATASHAHVITGAGAAMLLAIGLLANSPASALTLKECSVKYKEAQAAGKDMTWNVFRKAECGAEAAVAAADAAEAQPAATPTDAAEVPERSSAAAVFPTEVSPRYSNEKPGIARLKTCSDQFNANKAVDANGGLRWIQKGGGYWSECTKHLKG